MVFSSNPHPKFLEEQNGSRPNTLSLGEGQTDTPINHHNQGEVMTASIEKTVSPSPML